MAKVKQDTIVNEIVKDIKNKNYKPIYFFTGDEPYYIDKLAEFIEKNVLHESERDFNLSILYGGGSGSNAVDVKTILSTAKRFPMMSEYQVVIVREAQSVVDITRKLNDLLEYAKSPQNSTILVFAYKYKKLDGRSAFIKEVKKSGVYFDGKKKYENEMPVWVAKVLKGKGYTIDERANQMLVSFLGTDLSKVSKELDKLEIVLEKGTHITANHIEDNVGISKDYNTFELTTALGLKDVLKANRIINFFAKNPKDNPILATLPLIFSYFSKILIIHSLTDKSKQSIAKELGVNPFFVDEYITASRNYDKRKAVRVISFLRDADTATKGITASALPQGEILKELVYKILH
ncbi:MAG: DNA polymerase III subunit delta [Ichthyobacteriaceae bacterium]|nr:DNA polymerase III subunit delta [Ichthyobacteriaceae bacterium]